MMTETTTAQAENELSLLDEQIAVLLEQIEFHQGEISTRRGRIKELRGQKEAIKKSQIERDKEKLRELEDKVAADYRKGVSMHLLSGKYGKKEGTLLTMIHRSEERAQRKELDKQGKGIGYWKDVNGVKKRVGEV